MRAYELFENNVIDFSAKKVEKSHNDFKKKITDLASSFPNVLAKQEQLEKWVNSETESIKQQMDAVLSDIRLEFRPLSKNYRKDTTILEILQFTYDPYDLHSDLEEKQFARDFIKKHKDKLQQSLNLGKKLAGQLEKEADSIEWPAPWRRYTKYSNFKSDLYRFQEMLNSKLFEDGRIVKGVNTTDDVGPDEIKKQAKKFGFNVSKDGYPPTIDQIKLKRKT